MEIAEGDGERDGCSTIGGDGATVVVVAAGGWRRGRSSMIGEGEEEEEDQRELLSHSGIPFFAMKMFVSSLFFATSSSLVLFLGGEVKTKRSPRYSWLAGSRQIPDCP